MLINPYFEYTGKELFPLGIAYLAAIINQKNFQFQVVDENIEDEIPWEDIGEFNVIGLSITSPAFERAKIIVKELRKTKCSNLLIIAGGAHPTFRPEETISSGINIVVRGEGEKIFSDLLRKISDGEDWKKTKGISYKENNKIINNPQIELIDDLDSIPFPEWSAFDLSKYHNRLSMITSRGCPFNCTYCGAGPFWCNKVRYRSVENVIAELDTIRKLEYQSPLKLKFQDSTFTLDRNRTLKLMNLMIERNYDIHWTCETRIDCLDVELINLMSKAKCKVIMFGLESGSTTILEEAKRNMDLSSLIEISKEIHKSGIGLRVSVIFGLPGENEDTVNETLELLRKIKPNITFISLATIYPGTALEGKNIANHHQLWLESFGGHGKGGKILLPDEMTPKEYRRLANYFAKEIQKLNRKLWTKKNQKNS